MDNKLDINVTKKKGSDENLLKTVEEALMKKEFSGVTPPKGSILLKGESVLN